MIQMCTPPIKRSTKEEHTKIHDTFVEVGNTTNNPIECKKEMSKEMDFEPMQQYSQDESNAQGQDCKSESDKGFLQISQKYETYHHKQRSIIGDVDDNFEEEIDDVSLLNIRRSRDLKEENANFKKTDSTPETNSSNI